MIDKSDIRDIQHDIRFSMIFRVVLEIFRNIRMNFTSIYRKIIKYLKY